MWQQQSACGSRFRRELTADDYAGSWSGDQMPSEALGVHSSGLPRTVPSAHSADPHDFLMTHSQIEANLTAINAGDAGHPSHVVRWVLSAV
jgi:hypothetical protein